MKTTSILASLVSCALACAPCVAQSYRIDEIAPEESMVVAWSPDFLELREKLEASPFGALYERDDVREFLKVWTGNAGERWTELLQELDVDVDDVPPPDGSVGLAVYLDDSVEGDEPEPVALLSADFGENADAFGDFVDRVIEYGLDNDLLRVEDEEYDGIEIVTLYSLVDPGQDADLDEDVMIDPEDPFEIDSFFGSFEQQSMARIDDVFVFANTADHVVDAIDLAEDRDARTVGKLDAFRDSVAQHPDGTLAYVFLNARTLTESVIGTLESAQGEFDELDGMSERVQSTLTGLGLDEVASASLGLQLSTPDAAGEISMGVLTGQKRGVLGLIDFVDNRVQTPSFVSPDAIAFGRFLFDFGGVIPVVRDFAAAQPAGMERDQIEQFVTQMSGFVGPALDALGPDVYTFSTLSRPFDAESQRVMIAVRTDDEQLTVNTLMLVGSLLQMTPREFEGGQIFEAEMLELSIGVGSGYLFYGPAESVEDTMRAAANPDRDNLGDTERFEVATAPLAMTGPITGYSELKASLEYFYYTAENYEDLMRTQLEDSLDAMGQEFQEEMMDWIVESKPEWMDALPNLDALLDELGDSSWEVLSTEDGFRGRWLWLRAED